MPSTGDGVWRFTSSEGLVMDLEVDGDEGTSLIPGTWEYDAGHDWFHNAKADVYLRIVQEYEAGPPEVIGTFVAIVRAGEPDEETHTGTYRPKPI